MHEAEDVVALRESWDTTEAMLGDAAFEVVRYAGVYVSGAAGEDVNVVGAAHGPIVRGENERQKQIPHTAKGGPVRNDTEVDGAITRRSK